MNRTFQVIELFRSCLVSPILTPCVLTKWLTQIFVDCNMFNIEAKANSTEKNLTMPASRQRQKTPWKPVKTFKIKTNNNLKSNQRKQLPKDLHL